MHEKILTSKHHSVIDSIDDKDILMYTKMLYVSTIWYPSNSSKTISECGL